jgi:hypothetical protein
MAMEPLLNSTDLKKYSDEELRSLLSKSRILTDALQAGPQSNGRRMEASIILELQRRENLRRMRPTVKEER